MHYAGIYVTIKLSYENNLMKEKRIRVMQGDYSMNIRCNQKFMFSKDRSIDFSVCLFRGYIRMICELTSSVFLGISTLPPAGRKKVDFQRLNRHRKQKFRCRSDKK